LTRTQMLVAGLVLLLAGAVGVAQTVKRVHMHGHGGMFSDRMLQHMTDYLNLTDAQQSQVKEIIAKEKPAMQPLFQQMAQSHRQMLQLVTSGNFDETKARDIASQQAQTMTAMEVQKASMEAQIYQLLTPDQKTKAMQFITKHEQRWKQHGAESGSAPPQNQ
jgi:protein CpxP